MIIKFKTLHVVFIYIMFEVSSIPMFLANFKKAYLRAKQNINAMSFFAFFYPLIWSSFRLFFLLLFGFWGYILGFLIGSYLFYFIFSSKYKVPLEIKLKNLEIDFSYLKEGLPMFLNSVIIILGLTMDRWIVLSLFGRESLGIYSTATMFVGFFNILPNTLSEVFFPKLLEKIKNDKKNYLIYFNKILFSIFAFLAVITLILEIIVPYIIRSLIPDYIGATLSTQILIIQSPFLIINSLGYYTLIGFGKLKFPALINSLFLPITGIISYFLYPYINEIWSVSLAVVIGRLVVALIWYVYLMIFLNKKVV